MNTLKLSDATMAERLRRAAADVIDSGWYINGPHCRAFERAFATFTGVRHATGVANGTEALELALRAVGVGPGGKVVTVANAGFYTSTAARAIGAEPVYVDVDADSHLMSSSSLDAVLSCCAGISAIVVTHLYGLLADMEGLLEVAGRYDIPVVEDCAQSHGASRGGLRAGAFGDIAAFSFYPTKNLGAIGDAGAICTQRDDLAKRVATLKQYGWSSKYAVSTDGGRNSRLDEMQAAFLSIGLETLDDNNSRRRSIANRFSAEIRHPALTMPPVRGDDYVAHLFVLKTQERDALVKHLAAAGVSTEIHYPIPDHKQAVPHGPDSVPVPLVVTEALAGECLSLPCHPNLSDVEVDVIINAVNAFEGR